MKGLSIRNPYAWLMLPPYNKIETRTWQTKYRGKVLLCCGLNAYSENDCVDISSDSDLETFITTSQYYKNRLSPIETIFSLSKKIDIIQGKAYAIGDLVGCREMLKEDEERCYVKYHKDLYCHIFENVKRIKPFTIKGFLRYFTIDKEIEKQMMEM